MFVLSSVISSLAECSISAYIMGSDLQPSKSSLADPRLQRGTRGEAVASGVEIKLGTMVTHMSSDRVIEYVSQEEGYQRLQADIIILAVGCYERSRGALGIPGERPAGVYTAGQAQRYLNIDGYMVGQKVFILGSGDIGLIMARRMSLEGAEVARCCGADAVQQWATS